MINHYKEFRNYKEFIQQIFKIGKEDIIIDYRHGPDMNGYQANVHFKSGLRLTFYSVHYKWLEDFLGVIEKVKYQNENRNM